MAAYLYGNIEITDPALYEQYRAQVPAVIAAHGGRYLVRGGAVTLLEGEGAPPTRQVILEFPDMARFQAWWDSPAYQPLRALRERATQSTLVVTEGL